MIEINADSVKNKNLAVADILDSYTGKLAQNKDILIRMSNEEYLTTISALRYAISYLREDRISRLELKKVIEANNYLLSTKNNSIDYGMFTSGIFEAIDNAR